MLIQEVKEKIKYIVAVQLGPAPEEINTNAHITNDLGADSLDLAEIIMAVEEEFSITLEDSKLTNLTTIDDFVTLVYSVLQDQ